jgi:hypothetical protein
MIRIHVPPKQRLRPRRQSRIIVLNRSIEVGVHALGQLLDEVVCAAEPSGLGDVVFCSWRGEERGVSEGDVVADLYLRGVLSFVHCDMT